LYVIVHLFVDLMFVVVVVCCCCWLGCEVDAHVLLVVADTCKCVFSACCMLLLLLLLQAGLRDGLRRDAGGG
jgi:hypothetical protein